AMPYAFLDDAPLEERRARAVALRRSLPEDARDLGRLDPQAIAAVAADAWPRARDAEELHEAMAGLVLLPAARLEERFGGEAAGWRDALERDGRVVRIASPGAATGDGVWLAATERRVDAEAAAAGRAE